MIFTDKEKRSIGFIFVISLAFILWIVFGDLDYKIDSNEIDLKYHTSRLESRIKYLEEQVYKLKRKNIELEHHHHEKFQR